jgi:hypothetical protein
MTEEWTEEQATAFHDALLRHNSGEGLRWALPTVAAPPLGPIGAKELLARGLEPRLRRAMGKRLIPHEPFTRGEGWSMNDLNVLIEVSDRPE